MTMGVVWYIITQTPPSHLVITQFAPKDASTMTRSKDFVFTTNNPTEEHIDVLKALDYSYIVWGEEVGDSGTPHLQGYVRFKTQRTMASVIKKMKGSHIEIKKGTSAQAIDYCKKDGVWTEIGEPPKTPAEGGAMEKKRWRLIYEKAKEGDEEWLEENEPNVAFKHMSTFRSHKKPKMEILAYADEDTPHEWWYGETGTGKSKALWEQYPLHYQKEKNKWWCGYTGQNVVVIEEADPKTMEHLASRMKLWADRYPFPGEIKGGRIEGIRPVKVIVLSNYPMEACFLNQEDIEPLRRRFRTIRF